MSVNNPEDLNSQIRQRINTLRGSTPIQFPNTVWTIPSVMWGRLTVIMGEPFNAAFGDTTRRVRCVGICCIQLFAPLGTGDGAILGLADTFHDGLINQTFGGVRYQVPFIKNIGDDNEGWYQVNVDTPFVADYYA